MLGLELDSTHVFLGGWRLICGTGTIRVNDGAGHLRVYVDLIHCQQITCFITCMLK